MLDNVERWLRKRELQFERTDEDTLATAFATQLPEGAEMSYPLYIQRVEDRFGDPYLRFIIVPLIPLPEEGYPPEVILTAFRINHDMPILKLALDSEGQLEMIIDVSGEGLTESRLNMILQLVVDYAGIYTPVLSEM